MSATLSARAARAQSPPCHALEVRDVHIRFASKRAEVTALEGIDLTVERGEFVSIAGPSGCGKSTLLKAVAPTAGRQHAGRTGRRRLGRDPRTAS